MMKVERKPNKVDQGGLLQQLNWYQVNSDIIESKSYLYDYLTDNGKSSLVEELKTLDYPYHPTDGFVARLLSIGTEIPEKSLKSFERSIKRYVQYGKKKVKVKIGTGIETKATVGQQRSFYQYIIPELGEVEMALDRFFIDGFKSGFSMLEWLLIRESRMKDAAIYADCYRPLQYELQQAIDGDEYYVESYKHMTKPQLRKTHKFASSLVDGCVSYIDGKKTTRKKKKKTPKQLVGRIPFQSSIDNSDINSVDPVKIIGAARLWIYETVTRDLTVYQALDKNGLEVNNTTIANFDKESSCRKKLTRSKNNDPLDILHRVKMSTRMGSMNIFDDLNTKTSAVHGRMNKNTILLKVTLDGDE